VPRTHRRRLPPQLTGAAELQFTAAGRNAEITPVEPERTNIRGGIV